MLEGIDERGDSLRVNIKKEDDPVKGFPINFDVDENDSDESPARS